MEFSNVVGPQYNQVKSQRKNPFSLANSFPLNMGVMRTIEDLVYAVPFVRSLINDITNRLHQPSTVQVKFNDRPEEVSWTDEKVNIAFNSQTREVIANIISQWVTHGVAVYRQTYDDDTTRSTRTPESVNFHIVNPAECRIYWRYTENNNVEYAACFIKNATASTKSTAKSGIETSKKDEETLCEIPYSHVLPFSVLSSTDSIFRSPVFEALHDIIELRKIKALMSIGLGKKVFPLTVKKVGAPDFKLPVDFISPDMLGAPNPVGALPGVVPISGIEVQEAVERGLHNAYTKMITDADHKTETSNEKGEAYAKLDPLSRTYESDLLKITNRKPLDPSYTLVPGLTLEKDVVKIDLPSWTPAEKEHLEKSIAMVLGVPPNHDQRARFSASIEAMDENYHATIEKYRPKLQMAISKMFSDVYGVYFTDIGKQLTQNDSVILQSLPNRPIETPQKKSKPKTDVPEARSKFYKIEYGIKHKLLIRKAVTILVTFSPAKKGNIEQVVTLQEKGYIDMKTAQQLAIGAARYPLNIHHKYTDAEYKKIDKFMFEVVSGKREKPETSMAEPEKQSPKRNKVSKKSDDDEDEDEKSEKKTEK